MGSVRRSGSDDEPLIAAPDAPADPGYKGEYPLVQPELPVAGDPKEYEIGIIFQQWFGRRIANAVPALRLRCSKEEAGREADVEQPATRLGVLVEKPPDLLRSGGREDIDTAVS